MSESATRRADGRSKGKRRRGDRVGSSRPAAAARPSGSGRPPGGRTLLHLRVARVDPDSLNLRAEPSTSAAVVGQLAEGTLLLPLGPADEHGGLVWVRVQAPGDLEGWAAGRFLDIAAAPSDATDEDADDAPDAEPARRTATAEVTGVRYRVNTDGIRLRAAPSTAAEILTELRSGTVLEDDGAEPVDASGHTWRRVRHDGQVGWVASQFLSPATEGRLRFDPNTPTELQRQDWTCSIRSTMWVLKSLGVDVSPEEAQDAMSPQYVRSDVGLLDASGAGIVAVLRDHWGIEAFNRAPVSFDEIAEWAGRYPIALGGRNWNHWTAVRGINGSGDLVLANPGGTGPRFGQQTLNRQQFADLGWFSAVVVPVD